MWGVKIGDHVSKVFFETYDGYIVFLFLIFPFPVPHQLVEGQESTRDETSVTSTPRFTRNNNAGDIE